MRRLIVSASGYVAKSMVKLSLDCSMNIGGRLAQYTIE